MADLQSNKNVTETGATGVSGAGGNSGGGGDMLDKGVAFLGRKTGYKQSRSTTEKISDGIRKSIQKVTGKDVPIADKDYSQNT